MTNARTSRVNQERGLFHRRKSVDQHRPYRPNKLSWVEKQFAQIAAKKIYKAIKPYVDMKSWKTTLAGAVAALGSYLVTVNDPAWLQIVGQVFLGLGMLLLGTSARDNKVSSEEAGAK